MKSSFVIVASVACARFSFGGSPRQIFGLRRLDAASGDIESLSAGCYENQTAAQKSGVSRRSPYKANEQSAKHS